MKQRTVRELAGEIWSECNTFILKNRGDVEDDGLKDFIDITLGVLARHEGKIIINDRDLPVAPLEVRKVQE